MTGASDTGNIAIQPAIMGGEYKKPISKRNINKKKKIMRFREWLENND